MEIVTNKIHRRSNCNFVPNLISHVLVQIFQEKLMEISTENSGNENIFEYVTLFLDIKQI